jgi:hypothetical protein
MSLNYIKQQNGKTNVLNPFPMKQEQTQPETAIEMTALYLIIGRKKSKGKCTSQVR